MRNAKYLLSYLLPLLLAGVLFLKAKTYNL